MRKILTISACLMVSACGGLTQSSIKVDEVKYDKIEKSRPVIIGGRAFIKKGDACSTVKDPGAESLGATLAISAASYLIKEGVAYGKDYLEKRAAYLNADVFVSASTFISAPPVRQPDGKLGGGYQSWPSPEFLGKLASERAAVVEKAKSDARATAQAKKGSTKEQIAAAEDAAGKAAAATFDAGKDKREIKPSAEDLCVLIVAGKYQEGASGGPSWGRFRDFAGLSDNPGVLVANEDPITKGLPTAYSYRGYAMRLPGLDTKSTKIPFQDLVSDPSLIVELHLIPTPVKDGVIYTIRPTYLFYPYPMHKGTANGLERKITVEVSLGENKPTILLERMTSGAQYQAGDLVSNYVSHKVESNGSFQEIAVKVSEGPDAMPTAKILTDIAAKDETVTKYLVDKLEEKAKERGYIEAKSEGASKE
ncbi:hypothetical protein [Pseudomonas aeruginosa]|uniref:hypothetical protein n=1 Tax=Pseudomonas aeruginosa TaxID=287 RepID=UPI0031B68659